ncbi:MAG: hypothetical protein QXL82_02000 [Candidatus Aenigmatarchaeota archaeon]
MNFIIDLSFWHYHTEKGKKSLCRQIYEAYRETKENFIITNSNEEFEKVFKQVAGKNYEKFKILRNFPDFERLIILDPYADKELTKEIVKENENFFVGGIVDVVRIKQATKMLARYLGISEKFPSYKIVYKGSAFSFPDRINFIVKVIVKIKNCLDVEKAIEESLKEFKKSF